MIKRQDYKLETIPSLLAEIFQQLAKTFIFTFSSLYIVVLVFLSIAWYSLSRPVIRVARSFCILFGTFFLQQFVTYIGMPLLFNLLESRIKIY